MKQFPTPGLENQYSKSCHGRTSQVDRKTTPKQMTSDKKNKSDKENKKINKLTMLKSISKNVEQTIYFLLKVKKFLCYM